MNYTSKTVILVLIFSLLSAGGGYYLGTITGPNSAKPAATIDTSTTPTPSPSSQTASSSATYNPFASSSSSSATTNPFDSTGTYQNPFSTVKGASTGYTNPFDQFVTKPTTNYRGF